MFRREHKVFKDRKEAGFLLARKLTRYKKKKDVIVLGIPRGGVVVAKIISIKLRVPFNIIVTKKIGAPYQEELAIGAVSEGGEYILDQELIDRLNVVKDYIEKVVKDKEREVKERVNKFRLGNLKLRLKSTTIILVDDGIATGATTQAAIKYLRKKKVKKIILAVPVAPKDSILKFRKLTDELIVLETPYDFRAVGQFYRNFPQVSDEEVVELLKTS